MYESLTSYIPRLSTSCHGEWIVDCENDGTPEHPIQMPFVDYDDIAVRFMEDVYRFIDAHLDMSLTNYGDILENNGIVGVLFIVQHTIHLALNRRYRRVFKILRVENVYSKWTVSMG